MPRGYKDEDETPPERDYDDWSIEKFCTSKEGELHREQLAFCLDRAPWIHNMSARQAGKSQGDCAILFDNARAENTTNIFLGLKGTGVKFSMWEPVWKPLCARFGVEDKQHNNTSMLTTFDNGSRVVFAGTDDLSNARKYLGNSFHGGVFIIDEAQSQTGSMLRYLIENLLPPTLTDTSRVYMTGVLPDVPAGYFYDRAEGCAKAKGWSHHGWGRAANVHTPKALEWLANHMREFNIPADDPQILRDWYLKRVWDPNATAFRYDRARNAYNPSWLPNLECYAAGIDPGTRDRSAIQIIGWNSLCRDVWHIHEWVSATNSGTRWSEIIAEIRRINMRWPLQHCYYDAGGSKMEMDLFTRDSGVPVLKAANKADMPGQVSRTSDLLATGRLHVLEGSALESDFQLTRWDQEALADGRREWSSDNHPDAADALRYALGGYWDAYTEIDATPLHEQMLREYMKIERHRWGDDEPRATSGDDIAEMLGVRKDW